MQTDSDLLDSFAAMHILSRGTEKQILDYLLTFEDWFEKEHAFKWDRSGDTPRFVRTRLADPEVISARVDDLPLKAYWRAFLDQWPRGVPGDHIFRMFGQTTPMLAECQRLEGHLHELEDGSRPGMLLVPLGECEQALLASLRSERVAVWARPADGAMSEHQLLTGRRFMGTPLLDWISGTLGERGQEEWCGQWTFPAPPFFERLRYPRDQVEQLRRQLVREKRDAVLGRLPAEVRDSAAGLWVVEVGDDPAPLAPAADLKDRTLAPTEPAEPGRERLRPLAKSEETAVMHAEAEAFFKEHFASDGIARTGRVKRAEAFEAVHDHFRNLTGHHFRTKIWGRHAPEEWRRRGRY